MIHRIRELTLQFGGKATIFDGENLYQTGIELFVFAKDKYHIQEYYKDRKHCKQQFPHVREQPPERRQKFTHNDIERIERYEAVVVETIEVGLHIIYYNIVDKRVLT